MLPTGNHVVGGIEIEPAGGPYVGADPGVGGIGADQFFFAGGWASQEVSADIASGDSDATQRADQHMGEILADPAPLVEDFERAGCNMSRIRIVLKVAMDFLHEVHTRFDGVHRRIDLGSSVNFELRRSNPVTRIEQKFAGS